MFWCYIVQRCKCWCLSQMLLRKPVRVQTSYHFLSCISHRALLPSSCKQQHHSVSPQSLLSHQLLQELMWKDKNSEETTRAHTGVCSAGVWGCGETVAASGAARPQSYRNMLLLWLHTHTSAVIFIASVSLSLEFILPQVVWLLLCLTLLCLIWSSACCLVFLKLQYTEYIVDVLSVRTQLCGFHDSSLFIFIWGFVTSCPVPFVFCLFFSY